MALFLRVLTLCGMFTITKLTQYILGVLTLVATTAHGQGVLLASDSFKINQTKATDLSRLLLWRGLSQPESAFSIMPMADTSGLTFNAIRLTDSAIRHSSYRSAIGLKTNTALDYRFPVVPDRTTDTVEVQFDLIHDLVRGGGEGGRLVISMLHDYPKQGPKWLDVDSINKYHPFGRPTYNCRIMNKDQAGNNNLAGVMMYGGGHTRLGEVEVYRSAVDRWWLTGFSTEAGGFTPGSNLNYPRSGCWALRNTGMTSDKRWTRFTWQIVKDRLMLFRRWSNQPVSSNVKMMEMFTPMIDTLNPGPALAEMKRIYGSNITQLPPYYYYFKRFEAFRFFWAGSINASMANLSIRAWGPTVTQVQRKSITTNIQAWPNPSSDGTVYISGWQEDKPATLTLTDALGRVQQQIVVTPDEPTLSLQLPSQGVYTVRVQQEGQPVAMKRLVW